MTTLRTVKGILQGVIREMAKPETVELTGAALEAALRPTFEQRVAAKKKHWMATLTDEELERLFEGSNPVQEAAIKRAEDSMKQTKPGQFEPHE